MKLTVRYPRMILALVLSIVAMSDDPSVAGTIYTSTEESQCTAPPKDVQALYNGRGPDVQECKGVNGWRLFLAYTNERSWIDLKHEDQMWTTEEEVIQENAFGNFPNVSSPVEWDTVGGQPSSMIFRVNAQDRGPGGAMRESILRYFVVRLKQGEATFCGLAKTKEKARALAASSKCDKQLKKLAVPKKSQHRKQ